MRSVVRGNVLEGSVIAPHELVAEMKECAGVMNALDKDNLPYPGQLESGQVRNGGFGTISFHRVTAVQARNHVEGQSNLLYPVPDADGNPWVIERQSNDGILFVSFFACCTTSQALRLALRINGKLFNAPWSNRLAGYDSQLMRATMPVGPGVQLIEPLYAHSTAHVVSPIPPWTTTWENRCVYVREPAR